MEEKEKLTCQTKRAACEQVRSGSEGSGTRRRSARSNQPSTLHIGNQKSYSVFGPVGLAIPEAVTTASGNIAQSGMAIAAHKRSHLEILHLGTQPY